MSILIRTSSIVRCFPRYTIWHFVITNQRQYTIIVTWCADLCAWRYMHKIYWHVFPQVHNQLFNGQWVYGSCVIPNIYSWITEEVSPSKMVLSHSVIKSLKQWGNITSKKKSSRQWDSRHSPNVCTQKSYTDYERHNLLITNDSPIFRASWINSSLDWILAWLLAFCKYSLYFYNKEERTKWYCNPNDSDWYHTVLAYYQHHQFSTNCVMQ